MKLSIVSTLYNSESTIEAFVQKARSAAKKFGGTYEIVLVNDGSLDHSGAMALELAKTGKDIVLVELSRNFGHHRALMTGIQQARGEIIFVLDSDLEEDPAWLEDLYEKLLADRADMVCAVQMRRKGGLVERLSGALFYKIFDRLIELDIPRNSMVARIFTRRLANILDQYTERAIFLPGLFAYSGFAQSSLALEKGHKGKSEYSMRRRASLAVNAITSFSSTPLRAVFYAGILISGLAFLLAMVMIGNWFFWSNPPSGWTSIFVSVWLLGGMILSSLGILGLYLARVFDEAKARPAVIISQVHDLTRKTRAKPRKP